jgi:hypothetical protein
VILFGPPFLKGTIERQIDLWRDLKLNSETLYSPRRPDTGYP